MTQPVLPHPSSYRDPSGFIFEKEGTVYRQVNQVFKEHFEHFIQSGCYQHLAKKELLIFHENASPSVVNDPSAYTILKPEQLEFISYPYEWSFGVLKDAALLTLQIAREALGFDMVLKDATPYNVQWHKGRLIFIDTLSFEKYEERPWIAYRQFCENFLGPLLLMHYSKKPMQQLLLAWPDGIPLDIVRSLLPQKSRFSLHTYLHIHLHSKVSSKKKGRAQSPQVLSRQKLLNLFSSLEILVGKLHLPALQSTWSGYYQEAAERDDYLEQKRNIISAWLKEITITKAADLGANQGEFSKLPASSNIFTVAADFDPYCIDSLYSALKAANEKNIHPLVLDLSNPSPAIGVNNQGRASFINRLNTDLVMALALLHHLAIGKNIPFERISDFFASITNWLIIEFVPKDDKKVAVMLSQKTDIYSTYSQQNFEQVFKAAFAIEKREIIPGSSRVLYLMKKK